MIEEPFTQPKIYEVVIKHPLGKLGTVTARSAASAAGPEVGRLRTGNTLIASLDFIEGGEIWATIIDFPDNRAYNGAHFALAYPNTFGKIKEFGTWELVNDTIPDEPQTELPRYYVKEDWDTVRWNFKVRNTAPNPAIMPTSSTENNWPQTDFCKFPVKWQNFWKNLLAMQKYGKLFIDAKGKTQLTKDQYNFIASKWKDLTSSIKAYNNGHGTETTDPRFESLITCGNYVYEVTRTTCTAGRHKGKTMILLYSFDVNDEPPAVTKETLNDPRVQFAKIVYPGKYLSNFSHLGLGVAVPVPFLTNGRRFYPLEELREA